MFGLDPPVLSLSLQKNSGERDSSSVSFRMRASWSLLLPPVLQRHLPACRRGSTCTPATPVVMESQSGSSPHWLEGKQVKTCWILFGCSHHQPKIYLSFLFEYLWLKSTHTIQHNQLDKPVNTPTRSVTRTEYCHDKMFRKPQHEQPKQNEAITAAKPLSR